MDSYNVSLQGFFYLFFYESSSFFSFQNGLCQFCFIVFFFKTLWIVTMFSHKVFVLLQCFATCFFFNYLCRFFFNIELVENSDLTFPACFFFHLFLLFFQKLSSFFCVFFFRIFFVDFIFLIWSWLKI